VRRASIHSVSPLFTIGYEKSRPEAVRTELTRARVQILVDTRAVAASRKPGFSKRQLAAFLDENGIASLHLQKLGMPAEGRQTARAGDMQKLWRIYDKHLKTPDAKEAMAELVALVRSGRRICLLCFERDPAQCHRSRIAAIVRERTGAKITDLVPPLF
jgi:uncharacterized protein (DUF488 family)